MITAKGGGSAQSTANPQVSLSVAAGDTIVCFTTQSVVTGVSGPGTQNWQQLAVTTVAGSTMAQFWAVESATAASGLVTANRTGTANVLMVVQSYGGVAQITSPRNPNNLQNTNPIVVPGFAFELAPGDWSVAGINWGFGTNVGLSFPGSPFIRFEQPPMQTLGLAHGPFTQTNIAWTNTSGTPTFNYQGAQLVAAPFEPPPGGGTIKEIKDQIKVWRLAEHRHGSDRLYMLRGASRKTKLDEIQTLADQLKAAQGEQIRNMS